MSYLVVLPCMAALYLMVGRLGLPRTLFVLLSLLLTIVFAEYRWFVPGVDAVIAACISMAAANLCAWFFDTFYLQEMVEEGEILEPTKEPETKIEVRDFCSRLTHDFAVCPKDSVFAVGLINNNDWLQLASTLTDMSSTERQGFYANLNYSSISERSLQNIVNAHPKNADAQVLMGHVKLCLAKRLGLKPGAKLDEPVALAITQAFQHFNLALRINPDDSEALCGLLMAKGFTGLSAEHVLRSLELLLQADPTHLHGVIAAARFLVVSPMQANGFVTLVEITVNGKADSTVVIAKMLAHIECIAMVENGANNSQVIADVYSQLRIYQQGTETLGSWQRGISDNVIAYVLQLIGDTDQAKPFLNRISGLVSPYPWQKNTSAV